MRKTLGAMTASMLVLTLAFSAALVYAGNLALGPVSEAPTTDDMDDWTIMVYMAGDNNLENYSLSDLDEMELIGSSDNVNMIALIDTHTVLEGTHYYVVDKAEDSINHIDIESGVNNCDCEDVLGECPEGDLNMGDGETLKNFIVDSVAYAPAENYMLVLWDHGGGWYGVCWDESSIREEDDREDRLTVDEFANAIRDAEAETGVKMTVIGFDACLMSMVEVAYEIRDLADYMLASVTGIPMAGWPYDLSFDDLIADSSMDAEELCAAVIDGYVEYYSFCAGEGLGGWTGVTLSMIDLSVMDELAGALDTLSYDLQELYDSGEASRGALLSAGYALTPCLEMYGQAFAFVDIGILAEALGDRFESIADDATAVADAVASAVPIVDWVKQTTGGAFVTTGLTVYYPAAYYYTYPDYGYVDAEEAAENNELIYFGLDFTIDTNWDEFVLNFCPAVVE